MVYQIETTGYYGKNPFRSKKGKGWKKATKSDKHRTAFYEIRMSEGGFKTKKEAKVALKLHQDHHHGFNKLHGYSKSRNRIVKTKVFS